jgi:hypothetical protein
MAAGAYTNFCRPTGRRTGNCKKTTESKAELEQILYRYPSFDQFDRLQRFSSFGTTTVPSGSRTTKNI